MPPVDSHSLSDLPAAQRQRLEAWADKAHAGGWLSGSAVTALDSVKRATPSELFDTNERPLVAGLFGGTGVGKSTLLNRLAGEPVARASAERPTSRDITVYVHRSQMVDRLPAAFPMQHMRTALHNNDRYRHVMFIDMPDFDSVESANRELVDIWLPHLDVVLYVVSPERYRDDQGWRLLLQHAPEHAWLFVMNHWDRAEPVQLEDFRQQLGAAGMTQPLIFRSDSSAGEQATGQSDDDFADLCEILVQLADDSIIKSLDELGIMARLKSLKAVSDTWLAPLADDSTLETLQTDWQQHWQHTSTELERQFSPRAQQLAQQYAEDSGGGWLRRWRGSTTPAPTRQTLTLVDEALLQRLDTRLEDFINDHGRLTRLPPSALKQAVAEPYARVRRDFATIVDDALAQSLALPGSRWQRRLLALLSTLSLLLPLAAMAWIAWRVISGFADGGSDPTAYLGSNFAINSALLLGLSWLLPTFLHRKLSPSREKAALRGARQGMSDALAQTSAAIGTALTSLQQQSGELRQNYLTLWESLPAVSSHALPETVQRMLAEQVSQPDTRSLDVRANTHNSTDSTPVS